MTAQGMYYLIRALVTLVAIPFHEAGHALAAWLLGDPTAKREGRGAGAVLPLGRKGFPEVPEARCLALKEGFAAAVSGEGEFSVRTVTAGELAK